MTKLYTYEVSRIHARETALLSPSDMNYLISLKTYNEAISYLLGKGIGGENLSHSDFLLSETNKLWDFIAELKIDRDELSVLFIKKDFHNLKATIKSVISGIKADNIYLNGHAVSPKFIEDAILEEDYSALPQNMQFAAIKAVEALNNNDTQLCDTIIDKASLIAIKNAGEPSKNDCISRYSEMTVALADIKIALWGNLLSKDEKFIKNAMAPCATLDISVLSHAAAKSYDSLLTYLKQTTYHSAVIALDHSMLQFEKWCDNFIIENISREKFASFTLSPIIAYILAKENEINMLRIILSGKANHLNNEIIRERLRDIYV